MRGGKQISDYEINGSVRRELVVRGIDMTECHYRTSGGAVEVTGKIKFKEPKAPHQVIKELTLLEGAILGIRGVKRLKIELDEWERTSGKWSKKDEDAEKAADKPEGSGGAPT